MTTMASRVTFNVHLPEDYMELIESALLSELDIAQKKWGVKLSEETVERVRRHSLNQLSSRVNLAFRTDWNFRPEIAMKVKGLSKNSIDGPIEDLRLPEDIEKAPSIKLILGRDGLEVESEPSDATILPSELQEYTIQKIIRYTRTAVFYGVGSYKS